MSDPGATWRQVAQQTNGADYAHRFAAHFEQLAAGGQDVHGEADLVAGLVAPGSQVLDAGCGTGRVAGRLHELGFRVVGADVDETMVAVARERLPELDWHVADLAALDLPTMFDLVVAAGNVVPFIEPAALAATLARMAAHLAPDGLLVTGFGTDPDHLPPGGPVVPLSAYDRAAVDAGLEPVARFGGWTGEPFAPEGGYAVTVHRRRA